ncbi:pyridoxal phosphate-dependent aminotransferase [Paraliomyxa miuraensis]|uniref:pyridoxal phosphate-dependent aminotransferase n=1 Tax=Paraliomyxa miuraensis TaxID=376150 RepID=UPI0022583B7B|nr:aminotransferase class I/II-fold pyridoxal phosphate-dependent enzyme [Paraliomyxa miuraensis]MCX4243240.1 aminotransferase class I/II-fold pyridoxal phosphate-dependent enzyme [Paraliomyxa miuraensis]
MAAGLVGSEILAIAADIRERLSRGEEICNLTVGDFSPAQFGIPAALRDGIASALAQGHTNYPPSSGIPELRAAVARLFERRLGLTYPVGSVLIASGARPLIYGTYRAVVDRGDRVVYPVPSWNNNHYTDMLGADGVPVSCGPDTRFLPTREDLARVLPGARLLCINSPLNPTGTAIEADALRGICEEIVAENHARRKSGQRPLYLMYDQVYWMLRVPGVEHVTPPGLVPEMADYTIFVDGISKAFAATGLRVGWTVGPADVIERMGVILGHVGAWAPRPEQHATSALLDDDAAMDAYVAELMQGLGARLERLYQGFSTLAKEGLLVEAIPPMGAIYLTVRVHPFGRRTPSGTVLSTNEDVRRYLLDAARVAVVPFQAFGVVGDEGWFRLSVGAVGLAELDGALERLGQALRVLD